MPDELNEGTATEGTEDSNISDVGNTEELEAGTTQEATEAQSQQPESFINPADLPPELKPHWKRMHGAYTKKMQEFSKARQAAEVVDRFNNDANFAKQTVASWAAQNGYSLVQAGQGQGTAGPAGSPVQQQVSPQLVEQVKATLPTELQWMAPSLAAAQHAMLQSQLQPLLQQQQQQEQARLNDEYESLATRLSEEVPGWEEHEEKMLELYTFLQSPKLSDVKHGSKLKLLYALATGNAAAITEASKRMVKAVKRPTSGATGTPTTTNMSDRIRKADKNAAWDLAIKEGMRQSGFSEQ